MTYHRVLYTPDPPVPTAYPSRRRPLVGVVARAWAWVIVVAGLTALWWFRHPGAEVEYVPLTAACFGLFVAPMVLPTRPES